MKSAYGYLADALFYMHTGFTAKSNVATYEPYDCCASARNYITPHTLLTTSQTPA